MNLRELKIKDASLMLKWMHDETVVRDLQTNFYKKNIQDCVCFIQNSLIDDKNLHLAIVDDNDCYMGTVSLKNIDKKNCSAEFAITVCAEAMGRGYSAYAMRELIRTGIEEIGLKYVYWCVSKDNIRALKFYDKNGFERVDSKFVKNFNLGYSKEQISSYIWYLYISETK